MSKKITKISNLKNLESFLQVNYLNGFKYIDKAGEILNMYQSKTGAIVYDMSPNRLIIPSPLANLDEIKISNVDLWCHYINPKNLGESERIFLEESEKLLKIIEVGKVTRIGWRNYYVYDLTKKPKNLNALTTLSNASIRELHFQKDLPNDIKSSARIKLLKQKDDNKIVLFFDLDVYLDREVGLTEGLQSFNKLRSAISSSEILDLINEIIQTIDK